MAQTSSDNGVIPSLDGLRAISISIVLVSHAGYGSVVAGGLGVTIFFFLSGYLITTLLMNERERSGPSLLAIPNIGQRVGPSSATRHLLPGWQARIILDPEAGRRAE